MNKLTTFPQNFDTLTAYLPPEVKEKLAAQAAAQERHHLDEVSQHINKQEWPLLFTSSRVDSFAIEALSSFKEGMISAYSFATSQLFFNTWTHPENKDNVRVVSIFTKNQQGQDVRNKNASDMIRATMKSHPAVLNFLNALEVAACNCGRPHTQKIDQDYIWSAAEEKEFYNRLWKMPKSEHSFLLVRDNVEELPKKSERNVMDQINLAFRINSFSRLLIQKAPWRMIPSRGMAQALLEAFYPETAPAAVYRLCLSTVEGLHQTLKQGGRDLFQSFALLPEFTPTIVDTYPAPTRYAEPEMHDYYHQIRISAIPMLDREFFFSLIDFLEPYKDETTASLRQQLIDMEHSKYDTRYKQGSTEPLMNFWLSVNSCINKEAEIAIPKISDWLITDCDVSARFTDFIDNLLMDLHVIPPGTFSGNLKMHLLGSLKSRLDRKELIDLLELFELFVFKNPPLNPKPYFIHYSLKPFSGGVTSHFAKQNSHLGKAIEARLDRDIEKVLAAWTDLKNKNPILTQILSNFMAANFLKYFDDYIKSGFFDSLKEKHPDFVADLVIENRGLFEALAKKALQAKRKGDSLFEMIYRKDVVNALFEGDKRTLLHFALEAEDVTRIIDLTNDGAKVHDLKMRDDPTCPLTPLEQSTMQGNLLLPAILYFAFRNGEKGWAKRCPVEAQRFRDQALHTVDPWIKQIAKSIPVELFSTKYQQASQKVKKSSVEAYAFYERLKKDGHAVLDYNEPQVKAFLQTHVWAKKGGNILSFVTEN